MTPGLFKSHTIIWAILLLVIPAIMFFSVKNLEFNNEAAVRSSNIPTETALNTFSNDTMEAALFELENGNYFLEILLKEPLKNPSALVFPMVQDRPAKESIGQIREQGVYRYTLEGQTSGFQLYDPIKDQLIIKIEF